MSDAHPANGPEVLPPAGAAHPPFPGTRLLFSILYGIIAWFALWIAFLLVGAQFVVIAVNGHANDELKRFTGKLVIYMAQVLSYMAFVSDDQPFPFGSFPK
ncbi:MAG TPA: DUF4389 domain-containing protein [Rhizomicrobium sp.]|jgi:hypothetical protein|nr:DUF4389 domain-containing protein [Rhizomicrobium sp.]HEX4534364.1 DUF4389 domain-containing protein [Rhizomicrobium sp.]